MSQLIKKIGCTQIPSHIQTIKQCSDLLALLRSKPIFLWKNQFELIVHVRLFKTYRFNFFMAKPLRKKCWRKIGFLWKLFLIFLKLGFWTNMESNAVLWRSCGSELLVFKICLHLLVKKLLKLSNQVLSIDVKFFF